MRIVLVGLLAWLQVQLLAQCVAKESVKESADALQASAADSRAPASRTVLDSSGYAYDPNDRSCDGFPRLMIKSMAGTCVGLVVGRDQAVDKSTGHPLAMPRTILQLKDSDDFLLVDMGGWKANNGSLNLLRKVGSRYEIVGIKDRLNMPHGISYGPDGFIYIGETDQISRFHFASEQLSDWQPVIKKLPRFKGYMHPLTQFTFDFKNGDLYVNAGAPSDHCYQKDTGGYVTCPEVAEMGLGAIFRYPGAKFKNIPPEGLNFREQTAIGLRNSMAIVVSDTGYLIQGENGRDFPEVEEPYEEINVIAPSHQGLNYGWPQCYDFHATSPEFMIKGTQKSDPTGLAKRFPSVRCDAKQVNQESYYQKPHALMPPHAAPLNMAYYNGKMLSPQLGGKLLVSWHGYQPSGHRLVAYNVDSDGRPLVKPADKNAVFSFDRAGGCPVQKPFAPRGGLDQYAPYTEVISGWYERKGLRPKGAPVGFTVAHDGAIWIVEDKNRTVLRLASTTANPIDDGCSKGSSAETEDPRMSLLAWRSAVRSSPQALAGYEQIQKQVTQVYCAGCHGGFKDTSLANDRFSTLDFMISGSFFEGGNSSRSKIYGVLSHSGEYPAMPPGGSPQLPDGPEGDKLVELVKNWIDGLPRDVDSSIVKIQIATARDIHSQPSSASSSGVCGKLQPGDTVYVDPRESTRVHQGGWLWTRIYVLPRSSRLVPGKCKYPEDGVYFIQLKKD